MEILKQMDEGVCGATKLEEKWGGWSIGMAIFGPQFWKPVSDMLKDANSARDMEAFKGY